MANETHIAMLKKGVKHWNAWRKQKRNRVTPDLNRAELYERDLSHFDFHGANLGGAELVNCVCVEANLKRAFLEEANLFGADLDGAQLWRANMTEADLSNASLV